MDDVQNDGVQPVVDGADDGVVLPEEVADMGDSVEEVEEVVDESAE